MPSFRLRVVAALLLVSGLQCVGLKIVRAQSPATRVTDVPDIAFEKYVLPNGLEVILSEDHRLPLVAVNVWYHVGPANEEPGRTGFAHLFEHMMFGGSRHLQGDSTFWKFVEGAGGSDINGTTSFDRTNYFETLPANELELGLWLESDRMGYLLDGLDQVKLSTQQDVVRNERRQSIENRPYGIVDEMVFHQLFPKGHPYYGNIIGSHTDIQAAQLGDVQNFFKKYYAPGNASVAIVGDIDKAATKKLVEKYFGPLKAGPKVSKPSVETPPITTERRVVVTDRVELPRVTMAWLSPSIFTAGDANADVAASALGGGKSSRLYKSLVYEKQIAQNVVAYQYSLMLSSVFMIEATARPGHTIEEVEAAVDAEVARFRETGPEPVEIDRARNAGETQIVRGLERLGGFGGVADKLNEYNHYVGDPGFLRKDLERYREITPASVKAFAEQLTSNSRVVVRAIPGQKELEPEPPKSTAVPSADARGESVNADEAWRSQPPTPGPARPLAVPVPKSFTLPNGLTVLVNERPGLPIVSASLVLKTGSGANPAGKPGLANFTAAMIDEGTTTRSALQIADEAAQLGGSLTTSSGVDSMQASITSLSRTFPQMLTLMADVVRHPSFPPEEIERQRASRLAQLIQQRDNPNAIANAVTAAALYGPSHPYGFTELGTEDSNKALTADDMREFWSKNFVANDAAVVVSGRITVEELRPLVEQAFGDWQRGAPALTPGATPQSTTAKIVLVDKPGAPQTQLRAVSIAAPRATPDYEAMRLVNDAFGGLFSSRINLNLREAHGYTYGASSQFVFRRTPGYFVAASGVRTDVTAPALGELAKELTRMRFGISADEITLARDSIVRSLPSEFETSSRVTNTTANLFLYDLPNDYYARAQARFSAVTPAQVDAAARKYFVPEKTLFVVVGDKAKIQSDIEKLNLGAIELWNADGTRASGQPSSR